MLKLLSIICVFTLSTTTVYAEAADGIIGIWVSENGDAKIKILKSGESYEGSIIWLKEPNYTVDAPGEKAGTPKHDNNNPDESLRDRPIIGLKILWDIKYEGENEWGDGEIYDPENGSTYSCMMSLESITTLNIRGYVGFSLFGRTTQWTRDIASKQ